MMRCFYRLLFGVLQQMAAPAKEVAASAAAAAPAEEGYTAEEVHKHDSDSDCWMFID